MLTIPGVQSSYCDGMTRRSCLQIGSLALGGLSLPEILRAEAESKLDRPIKGVIMVILPGGPTHLDMYDLKPDAPSEIRGEFEPIATKVPGMDVCELMPGLAGIADKLSVVRSLHGFKNDHNTHWCSTGWESHDEMPASPLVPGFPPGGWPSLGSILSKQLGPLVPGVSPAVDLVPTDADARFIMRIGPTQPGFLGSAHAGFEVDAVDRRNLRLNGVSLRRLGDRRQLLSSFDRFRRQVEIDGRGDGIDEFHQQAFDVLTSPRLAEALDLSREERSVKKRYGLEEEYPNERNGKTYLHQFLLARRVIEAGARCVTVAFSYISAKSLRRCTSGWASTSPRRRSPTWVAGHIIWWVSTGRCPNWWGSRPEPRGSGIAATVVFWRHAVVCRLLFQFLKPFAVPCGECRFSESAVTFGQFVVHDRVLFERSHSPLQVAQGRLKFADVHPHDAPQPDGFGRHTGKQRQPPFEFLESLAGAALEP